MDIKSLIRSITLMLVPIGLVVYPVLGVLFCVFFLALSQRQRRWQWWLPSFCLLISAFISAMLSDWRLMALGDVALGCLFFILLIMIYERLATYQTIWVTIGFTISTLIISIRALQQVLFEGALQATTFAFHPNIAAAIALLLCFGTLAVLGLKTHWVIQLFVMFGALLAIVALVLSGSRGAYLGFGAALVVWSVLGWIHIKTWWFKVGLFVIAGSFVVVALSMLREDNWGLFEVIRPRLESLGQLETTTGGRMFMVLLGLEMVAVKPFLGFGFGAWQRLVPEVEPSFRVDILPHSHNLYVELLLDGGSLLLVAVLMFSAVLGWALLRRAWAGSWAAAASFAALVGFAVNNLFDVLAYQPYVTGLFLIVLVQGLIAGEGAA